MLYTDYYKRFSKLVAAMTFVKRHWIPILIAAVAVLATAVTLTSTKGLVYDKTVPPQNLTYGEEFNYAAGAFMSGKIAYEFRADGSDEWSGEMPVRAGKYYVRALSYRAFGFTSYGKEYGFTISPKPIDVKVAESSVFGDKPQVSAELCYNDTISCDGFVYGDISLSETTVRAILGSVKITDENGVDVTGSYTLNAPEYGITFSKREIRVTVEKTEIEYDGNPHRFGGFEVTKGSLADGDVLTATFDSTVTEVGSIDVEPEFAVTSKNGVDVTNNYDIDVRAGKLEVKPQVLTVKTPSASKVYDGKELFCTEGFEIVGGKLADGHELVLSADNYSRITDAGTVKNTLAFVVTNGDVDVTKNYAIALETGTLEVKAKPVTVTTRSGTRVYNGAAYSIARKTDVTVEGLLSELGHDFSVNGYATVTDVGTVKNTVKIRVVDKDGKEVTKNYDIDNETAAGTLEITPRPVTVKTGDGTWTYDGDEHYNTYFTTNRRDTDTGLVLGHTASASGDTRMTDVVYENGAASTVDNVFAVTITSGGRDVTKNYEIAYEYGKLKILPRPVTVKADGETRVYNGMPLSADRVADISSSGGLLKSKGHYFTAVCSGEQTEVGSSNNTVVEVDILCDGESVKSNYAVSVSAEPGKLTVTKRRITVVTASGEWMYDGEEHSENVITGVKPCNGNDPPLVLDHAISARGNKGDYATITFVQFSGDEVVGIVNAVTPIVTAGDGSDKTGNYDFEYEYGDLKITKRPVAVKPIDRTKVYDDTPLTESGIVVTSEIGFADGDSASAACDGSITDVGTADNNITGLTVMRGGMNVTANYALTFAPGKLAVTAREITLKSGSKTFEYNGEAQSFVDYDLTAAYASGALASGHKDRVTEYATVTLVTEGAVENAIAIAIEKNGEDKTANYSITYDFGTIAAYRFAVTVTCGSRGAYGDGDWIYDGEDHYWTEFTLNRSVPARDKFAFDGDRTFSVIKNVVINSDGSVGSVQNFFYVVVTETTGDESVDKSDNYAIDYIGGRLTLNPRPITVKAKDREKIYDGAPLESDEFEVVSELKIAANEIGVAECDGSIIDVGTAANNITKFTIYGDLIDGTTDAAVIGVDVTYNYAISLQPGTLKITPREIEITTGSYEGEYDGKFHSNKTVTVTGGSLVTGHEASADERAGKKPIPEVMDATDGDGVQNEFDVKIMCGDDEKTSNYSITAVYGTLKVNPRKLKAITADKTWIYDGEYHSGDEPVTDVIDYVIEGEALDPHEIDASKPIASIRDVVRVSKDVVGGIENRFTLKFTRGGEDISKNYSVEYTYGTLKIMPREIEITTGSYREPYDGEVHYNKTVTVTGGSLVAGHTASADERDGKTVPSVRDVADGVVSNAFDAIISYGAVDVTNNYDITYKYGTLEVTALSVTVYTANREWIYDGVAHDGSEQFDGDRFAVRPAVPTCDSPEIDSVEASATNVVRDGETVKNKFTVVFTRDGADVSGNYDITYEYGTLKILPRPITVASVTDEFEYDGDYHSAATIKSVTSIYAPALVGEHRAAVVSGTSVRDVKRDGQGKVIGYVNAITVAISDGDNDVTYNYDITYETGTVTVTPLAVEITTESKTWVYDGNTHDWVKYSISPAVVPDAHAADEARTIAEITEVVRNADGSVGTKPNEFYVTFTRGDEDVSGNYDITYTYGYLKLEPVKVYYTTGSASKYFDGTPLTCATASIDNDPFVQGHVGTLTATGSITFAGSTDNTAALEVKDGDRDVTRNYELVPSPAPGGVGTLTVKAVKIKITTQGDSKVYDGTPLKCENYTAVVTEGAMPAGHTLEVKFGDGQTDAGSSDNAVTVKVTYGDEDMTGGYEFEYELGKLTVAYRHIIVVTSTESWVYDGKPHRGSIKSIGGDGLAPDQTCTAFGFTTITDVISGVKNKLAVKITDASGNDVTKNYGTIEFEHGTLSITPRKITVTTGSSSKMYDGVVLSEPTFEITAGSLAENQTAEVLIDTETKIRYAGTAENRLQILISDENNRAVTTNYEITWKYGELEITKRPVTIETKSHRWRYDGEEHYDNGGNVGFDSPNELAECDKIIGENYATITEPGAVANIYTVKIYSDDMQDADRDATNSYSFKAEEIVYGILEVSNGSGDGEGGEGEGDGEGDGGAGGNGNGGGSGGGQLGSGQIGLPDSGSGGDGSALILTYKSDYVGTLYLRQRSFGDYRLNNKTVWGQASNYAYTVPHDTNRYAFSYLTSAALENDGVGTKGIEIKLENIASYVLPYYVGFGSEVQTSDVVYAGANKQYTASFYPYALGDVLLALPQEYSAAENRYFEFVNSHYTNIPDSTLEYMRKVIEMQKFDASKRNGTIAEQLALIESVARYVRGAATYSLDYNKALDSESDPAVEFLRSYKTGICSHYATSGTMLLRALGFPARYTSGVMTQSDGSDEWHEVIAANAHAWVEVYVKGVGWIQVEVTGGGDGTGEGGDGGNTPGGNNPGGDEKPNKFTVKPLDIFVEQGSIARPENVVIEESGKLQYWMKNKGYSYTVKVEGEQRTLGTGASAITEFKLYNSRGVEVTDEFDITFAEGKLCVTKPQVGVYIYGRQSVYNGNGVYFDEYDYEAENLPAGYTLELAIDGIGIESGAMTVEGLRKVLESKGNWYTVRNSAGVDVTASFSQNYFVLPYIDINVKKLKIDMSEAYVLEISPRNVSFISGSAVKAYDGAPLVEHTALLTFGSLLRGHRAEFKFFSERIDVGMTANIFDVTIYDENDNNVTYMYKISLKYGTLEVVYE